MTPLLFATDPHARPEIAGAWDYRRPAGGRIVELGTVRGLDVALPVHFHDEDQVTFVLSGRRRFVIDGELRAVTAGQGIRIPARTPHRSLSEPSEVVCVNLYTPAGACLAEELIAGLARQWRRTGRIGWADLAVLGEGHQWSAGGPALPPGVPEGGQTEGGQMWEPVSRAARNAGLSREGFSRRFKQRHGVPPHAFWLLERLNGARRLLRAGEPIAAVAAETGFSDQSHLGRCFRRAFGVTPGRYRAG